MDSFTTIYSKDLKIYESQAPSHLSNITEAVLLSLLSLLNVFLFLRVLFPETITQRNSEKY